MSTNMDQQNRKRSVLRFARQLGLVTEEPEVGDEGYEPPTALRDPPVKIEAITRSIHDMPLWQFRGPQTLDISLYGSVIALLSIPFFLAFWIASTFPASVKLAGIGGTLFVLGVALLVIAVRVQRR